MKNPKTIIIHIDGTRNTINMYDPHEKEPTFWKKFFQKVGSKLLKVFR